MTTNADKNVRQPTVTIGRNIHQLRHWGNNVKLPKQLKTELPNSPVVLLLGIAPKTSASYHTLLVHVHCCPIRKSKEVYINRWLGHGGGVHIHNGIVFSCEGKWKDGICKKIDGSGNCCGKGGFLGSERQICLFSCHIQIFLNVWKQVSGGGRGPWDGRRGL